MTSSETHFSKAFCATDLCRDIETLFPELVTIRHTLHQHPEKVPRNLKPTALLQAATPGRLGNSLPDDR